MKRFLSKIDPDSHGSVICWPWIGSKVTHGYGKFTINGNRISAHRFSYEYHIGPIPDGLVVRHRCDNPSCVNPHHLEIGTQADNMRDRDERGRRKPPKGSSHGCAKLTEPDVIEIRRLYADGELNQCEIAGIFNVNHRTVNHIVRRYSWRHL